MQYAYMHTLVFLIWFLLISIKVLEFNLDKNIFGSRKR